MKHKLFQFQFIGHSTFFQTFQRLILIWGWWRITTETDINVKNSSNLVYVSVTKWAVQTLHLFEVKDFFAVCSHNFDFCVIDCAFSVQCAIVAEEISKSS